MKVKIDTNKLKLKTYTPSPIKLEQYQPTFCWIRCIQVILKSQKYPKLKPIIYGYDADNDSINQLNIKIKGTKKISALQDQATIEISNLTYADIYHLIAGQYYEVTINVGYRSQKQMMTFFKGYVAYISDKIQERRDNTCYILCASELVAKWSQQRINFNCNSSINMYAALNYLTSKLGISSEMLSPELKNIILNNAKSQYCTPASLLESLANNTSDFSIDTDSSIDGNNLFNFTKLTGKRYIKIDPDTINFTKGNPTINSSGLKLTVLPTFNFSIADIIEIENKFLDTSESSLSDAQTNFKTNYIDPNGRYVIIQIDYTFENRNQSGFYLDITARALSLFENITGVN